MKAIVALSTAPMNSAIHVIRVSGDNAFNIVNLITSPKIKRSPHTIQRVNIVSNKEVLDHVLINVFVAPKSFTGEDVLEINCHGGIYLARRIIQLLIAKGCKPALNGEFTQRAFMNRKISLNEAESINNLINASSDNAITLANNGLSDKTIETLNAFKNNLFKLLGQVEINIDYPEFDDVPQISDKQFKHMIDVLIRGSNRIILDSKKVVPIREGLNVAIVGEPNVGKSSLLNALLNEQRAIVSNLPGTTRDIVKEQINIRGVTINLLDTAGLRTSKNQIEKIGIQKTQEAINAADLILWVIDGSKSGYVGHSLIQQQLKNKKYIIVANKSDLGRKSTKCGIPISAKKHRIDNLIKAIIKSIPSIKISDDTLILQSSRSISLMENIFEELMTIKRLIKNKQPIDLSVEHLHLAYRNILEILGDVDQYAFTEELFRKFCVGK